MTLKCRPLTLAQANAAVEALHRHHKPVRGHRFSLGAYDGDRLVGVAIVGRPVARAVPAYEVAEVTRVATDGYPNACSFLYGRCARAARAMGFLSIQTYTLPSEGGASLRAAGWVCEGQPRRDGKGWNNRAGRKSCQPTEQKTRWRVTFAGNV